MSVPFDEPPQRLKEQSDQADVFARIAGQAARDLPQAKPLSPGALARIAGRIDQRAPTWTTHRRHVWVLVAAAFVLGVVTTASAQRLDVVRQWLSHVVPPTPPVPPPPRPTGKGRAGAHAPTPPQAPLPETVPPPAEAPQAMPPTPAPEAPVVPASRSRAGGQSGTAVSRKLALAEPLEAARPSATSLAAGPSAAPSLPSPAEPALAAKPEPAASATPVVPGTVLGAPNPASPPPAADTTPKPSPAAAPQATEHLTQAVRALRVEHSPKTALRLLDRHAQELDRNGFAHEALLLRVEAMLALGRQAEVLRLLDATSLTDVTAARALLVMRGELRAAANRCADAVGDFALVLAQARQPPKAALAGRARCRQQLGDQAGARADLERYRSEYPDDHALDDLAAPSQRP